MYGAWVRASSGLIWSRRMVGRNEVEDHQAAVIVVVVREIVWLREEFERECAADLGWSDG